MTPKPPDVMTLMSGRLITLACGCRVKRTPYASHELIFCPLHKAAPELLAACKAVLTNDREKVFLDSDVSNALIAAVRAAEGCEAGKGAV